jgi:hypothetical protein
VGYFRPLLSFLGFVLPWFKFDKSAQWFYGGWDLLTNEGLTGLWIIFALYLILAIAIFYKPIPGSIVVVLTTLVILSTLVIVAMAAGDALNRFRAMGILDWNIGLFLMLPGHAILLWGAIYRAILPIIDGALIRLDAEIYESKLL